MDREVRPSVGEQRTLARRWKRVGSIRGRIGGFAVSGSGGGKGEGFAGWGDEWVWQGGEPRWSGKAPQGEGLMAAVWCWVAEFRGWQRLVSRLEAVAKGCTTETGQGGGWPLPQAATSRLARCAGRPESGSSNASAAEKLRSTAEHQQGLQPSLSSALAAHSSKLAAGFSTSTAA